MQIIFYFICYMVLKKIICNYGLSLQVAGMFPCSSELGTSPSLLYPFLIELSLKISPEACDKAKY